MTVLAVDQGTSATKALVVAGDGTVLGEATRAVNPRPGPGGAVEQDPRELLESIVSAGGDALRAAGTDAADVAAVGIGNQGETVLAFDRVTGEPHGPALSWQDRRAAPLVEELGDRADRLAEICGLRLDPYFAAPKMAWLAREAPAGAAITTVDAWLTHRLVGAFVTDAATASRTMLLDLAGGEWSDEACEMFGVDPAAQPEIVGNAQPVGATSAFGPELAVSALVVDQQAALLAQSCLAAGEAKCTYGTGAFLLANAGTDPPRSRARLSASVAWRLGDGGDVYCLDGQLYTAAAAVRWAQSLGLPAAPPQLAALCDRPAPAPDAPVFVPALAGLGAPHWSPGARGAWSGLSLAHGPDDLVDAVLWGIAALVAEVARAMAEDLGAPIRTLRVDGGLAGSRRLLQAQADLQQAPVQRYPSPDATALGIAALARLGAGHATTVADAIAPWQPAETFEPRLPADEAAAIRDRFAGAAAAA